MKALIAALWLLFLLPAHADDIWNGRDKGQHFELGMVEGVLVSAYYNEPGAFNWKALVISAGTEAAHQIYAIRTNPNKVPMEGLADFLSHSIGSAIGVGLSQNTIVEFRHRGDETHIQVSWKF